MISFAQFLVEQQRKRIVFAFGRMNPPTTGHELLVNTVHKIARDVKGDHKIVLSHSHDNDKNPLTPQQKLHYARHFFPETNFEVASKKLPTLIQHLSNLHGEGYTDLHVVGGSDREKEFTTLINKYNGKPDKSGKTLFNFKTVKFHSSGDRDDPAGGKSGTMSASQQRRHVKNNDFQSFRQGVPSHVSDSVASKMFNDVKRGIRNG